MTMWANFAKYTNPTQVGVYIKWDTFTHDNPSILIIDRSFNMSDFKSLNYRAIQFWNDYYPNVLSFSAACCNMTDSASTLSINIVQSYSIYLTIGQLIVIFLPLSSIF